MGSPATANSNDSDTWTAKIRLLDGPTMSQPSGRLIVVEVYCHDDASHSVHWRPGSPRARRARFGSMGEPGRGERGCYPMRATRITCDRCRRPVGDDGSLVRASGAIRASCGEVDLCASCGRDLIAWLREAAVPADDCAAESRCLSREPFHP